MENSVYRFQSLVSEQHDEYHVQSLLMWESPDGDEWVAGDTFKVTADAVDAAGEHDAIVYLLSSACARIARKVDRQLF